VGSRQASGEHAFPEFGLSKRQVLGELQKYAAKQKKRIGSG
jgi:hypothetical protein